MTIQDVDPETYYAIGKGLFEKAGRLYDAFTVNVAILGDTGAMAGSDDAGTTWAASYDERVADVLGAVNDLTEAMENYGGVVIQAGYNHAIAEHNATPGNQGPSPVKPPEPASAGGVLSAPPSAGGPGEGLLDDGIGLVAQVGVPVPDGDTEKISTAAGAWVRLATVHQTKAIVEALEVDARTFRDTSRPKSSTSSGISKSYAMPCRPCSTGAPSWRSHARTICRRSTTYAPSSRASWKISR